MSASDVFLDAFNYASIIGIPLFCLSIVALSDEILILLKRSVIASRTRSRRR